MFPWAWIHGRPLRDLEILKKMFKGDTLPSTSTGSTQGVHRVREFWKSGKSQGNQFWSGKSGKSQGIWKFLGKVREN